MTDSAGIVAIDDPTLLQGTVFFQVFSHGYEIKPDGFGAKGRKLEPRPGASAKIELHRVNVAERLYRITGEGVLPRQRHRGTRCPDQTSAAERAGDGPGFDTGRCLQRKDPLFWGDTGKQSYPIGAFLDVGRDVRPPSQRRPRSFGGCEPRILRRRRRVQPPDASESRRRTRLARRALRSQESKGRRCARCAQHANEKHGRAGAGKSARRLRR